MSYQNIINHITENILKNIKKAIDTESHSDQTFCAKVTEILDQNKIKILYSGNSYTASTPFPCEINEIVKICAPCNNWNELFVLCKNMDLSNLTLNEIEKTSAAFPSFSPKETLKVIFGKIEKWQQDCLAKIENWQQDCLARFGDCVLKSMLSSQHINSEDRVPTSALVYSMRNAVIENQNSVGRLKQDLYNCAFKRGDHNTIHILYPFVPAVPHTSNYVFLVYPSDKPIVIFALPTDYVNRLYLYIDFNKTWMCTEQLTKI